MLILVINRVRVLGNELHTPTQFSWSITPGVSLPDGFPHAANNESLQA